MTETVEVAGTCDLICNLKAAVTALECQQKMNLLKKQPVQKSRKPSPPPMFIMIPLEHQTNGGSDFSDKVKSKRKNRDYSETEYSESIASSDHPTGDHHREDGCGATKGPALRGGVLHSRCNCIHRDGLQDRCPLTECKNDPDCATRPWANCSPARYFRSRFPDNYP